MNIVHVYLDIYFPSKSETPLGTIVTVDLFLIQIIVKLIECGVVEST